MERKIYEDLLLWKNNEDAKPLLVEGARQVGKTTIIKKFIENEFVDSLIVDLENDFELTSILNSKRINASKFISTLEIYFSKSINKNVIIFIDEIQNVPYCITLLKYLHEEFKDLRIIASGSLISIKLNSSKISYPVGKIDHLNMYPIDFEEFLINTKQTILLKTINDNLENLKHINSVAHQKLMSIYYDFLIIGGMPEVVNEYIEKGFLEANVIKNYILKDYRNDISKYFNNKNVAKALEVYDNISTQLSKNNTKFQVSKINYQKENSSRFREYENVIMEIVLSNMVHKLKYIDKIINPLSSHTLNNSFKLFFNDVGFFSQIVGLDKIQIENNSQLWVHVKVGLTENFVYNELIKLDRIFCYKYNSKNLQREIDFILQAKKYDQIIIECKSSINKKACSFDNFIKEAKNIIAIKTSPTNFHFDQATKIRHIPLYAIGIYLSYLYKNELI